MMNCKIEKQLLFDFFKAQGIIEEKNKYIEIIEEKNKDKPNTLKKLKIENLDSNNRYYKINPENPYIKPNKQTECVIIEYNEQSDFMNIVFVEMKPKKVKLHEVLKKFERTFSWLYLLFNLLNDKEGKEFRVYFLLCKYSNTQKNDEVCKSKINIFHNLTVKYIRITKHSNAKEEMDIDFRGLISISTEKRCGEE